MSQDTVVAGKTLDQWVSLYPVIHRIMALEELFWANPHYDTLGAAVREISLGDEDRIDARERFRRFAPYIAKRFPETAEAQGVIESPLVRITAMHRHMERRFGHTIPGRLLLKCDSHLPISGSIKARGGIYAVLKHAETLAVENGLLSPGDDYSVLDSDAMRAFFSRYAISVGSTGNLGLSIGIMGAALGFRVFVHMSSDAKPWKKELLQSNGVTVIDHASDYSQAVERGRAQARTDARIHFIDDETSVDLFLGYAAAADRVQEQMAAMALAVDANHPMFVYLPCGVGGGPGGLTFGLKSVYGDYVHCFFAEPTHAPCMLLGLLTRRHERICVQDFGIDNRTEADGLAVGRPSGFVGRHMEKMISGIYTVRDDLLFILLSMLSDSEKTVAEPSAMASMAGPLRLLTSRQGQAYLQHHGLKAKMADAVHLVWSTGGGMVPLEVHTAGYRRGAALRGDENG